MIYPAYDAKEITGTVLLKNRKLMELWKWASDEGRVKAVSVGGKNYAVVMDDDLAQHIAEAAPGLEHQRYDDERGELV